MSDPEIEKLQQKVSEFVKAQKGYDKLKHEKLKAFCENKQQYAVVYGEDLHSGIAGFGETAGEAFEDFVLSWNHYEGFEWLQNEKIRLHHWEDHE